MPQVQGTATALAVKIHFLVKSKFAFFHSFRDYYKSLILSNVGKLVEEKGRLRLFTSSIKREVRHFHFVVVQ